MYLCWEFFFMGGEEYRLGKKVRPRCVENFNFRGEISSNGTYAKFSWYPIENSR